MAAISLMTDFGVEDPYVGLVKGVILTINPRAVVVDLTHAIPPYDRALAARTLAWAYPYFPSGTVHTVVVDPGVGSPRGIIALRSTVKKGTISTIVPQLSAGAEVTVPSQDVDTIVTEFGVADLRGRSVKDRARALINIAHPDFRPWLREEVVRLGIVPGL